MSLRAAAAAADPLQLRDRALLRTRTPTHLPPPLLSPPACCSAYQTLDTIAARDADKVAGVGLAITFGASPSLAVTDGSASCSDASVSVLAFDTTGSATCPAGTSGEPHPQANSVDTFVAKQCAPCDTGYQCAAGVASACAAGKFNELIGAASAAQCVGCPSYTSSQSGAAKCQECAPGTTPNAAKTTCELCPQGTFNNVSGTQCQACPAGTFRVAGGGDGTSCTKCPPGSWSAANAAQCTLCAEGFATATEGSLSCSPW